MTDRLADHRKVIGIAACHRGKHRLDRAKGIRPADDFLADFLADDHETVGGHLLLGIHHASP